MGAALPTRYTAPDMQQGLSACAAQASTKARLNLQKFFGSFFQKRARKSPSF
jgi:hypothetical protein